MKHRLVIIGSLHENVELIKCARSRGYYTIVCDEYINGPGKRIADKSYNIPVMDIDAISDICIREQVDGIIGSFSDIVFEQITYIADKVGLKWYVAPENIDYYRNKHVQKGLLQKLGISTPKHVLINCEESFKQPECLKVPFVIKPINGWGSRGVQVIESLDEWKNVETSFAGDIEAEEYCDAYEYNCITWVCDGIVKILGIGDRERITREKGRIGINSRIVYPAYRIDEVNEKVERVLQKFVNATGQKNGPLSMQFFYKGGEIIVGEIAGRVLGHEHGLIRLANGTDIISMLLDYVYNEDAISGDIEKIDYHSYSCGIYFMCHRGEYISDYSSTIELFRDIPDNQKVFFCKSGETFDDKYPYFAKIYFSDDNRSKLDEKTEYYFNNFRIPGKTGDDVSIKFNIESGRYKDYF